MSEQDSTQVATQDTQPEQKPETKTTVIPRIIHIVWVGCHAPPKEMMQTWIDKHPLRNGWTVMIHRDHEKDTICGLPWKLSAQIKARDSRREYNGVADCMRYEILHRYGGFAVDADSNCLKALDEGPFDFLSETKALACYESESVRPGMIACGFLAASPGHPFFAACIDDALKQDPNEAAWKAVGPLLMNRVALTMPDDIKVLPSRMFIPKHYTGAVSPGVAPIYAEQGWGSTRGYNVLRKLACTCPVCSTTMLRPSWG